MKKIIAFCVIALCSSMLSFAQMTDAQVTEYFKVAMAEGKSETKMHQELVARGVTPEQLMRIKNDLEASQNITVDPGMMSSEANPRAIETLVVAEEENGAVAAASEVSLIFGHDVFKNKSLTFEPNENTATPENYVLGPGDELIIEIWGYNEASIKSTISPEGKINISQIGPIYLGGLTIKEASAKIKKALRSKYASIGGDTPNSEVSITLGRIRSIQVNIVGEVNVPGTYRLSSFSTVFTALYRAGGVTETGSLRAIKVVRAGEIVAAVDVYGYLFNGAADSDIRLVEGDIVIVPPYTNIVDMAGGVKRPMKYELTSSETVSDALKYAGGFTSEAHSGDLCIERKSGNEKQIITVTESEMGSVPVMDGDVITVGTNFEKYANRLTVNGFVYRPGLYELSSGINTVKSLIAAAGGVREDAFLSRAIIIREHDDLSTETISVPLDAILSGKAADIVLHKNDILTVSGKHELFETGTLTINGLVKNPGTFPFSENTSVEDMILRAGGLQPGASMARVDIARCVFDVNGTAPSDTIGETFSFAIKDGLLVDGADEFVLEPYDVVSIRRSPAYQRQQYVTISGEVAFPGEYVLVDRSETLSKIIARAGGTTSRAYLKGGILYRTMNEEERNVQKATARLASGRDAEEGLDVEDLQQSSKYSVGVEMDKAVSNPGSVFDVALREGDEIVIPEFISTVRIQGNVMYPNTVTYIPGKGVDYYINQAGGFDNDAKKNKVYVVYMNGNVSKSHIGAKIQPGCEIIVPSKKERAPMSAAEVISLGHSSVSLVTMIATVMKLFM